MRLTLSLIVQIANAIECWTCDSGSMTDCILFGGPRTCPGHEDICFVEKRERRGKLVRIRQGCQQAHACEVQKRQNFSTQRLTHTNCRPEGFLRWPSSACRQCCYHDNCAATWTPKSRTEWSMSMREADPSLFRYEFIFDY